MSLSFVVPLCRVLRRLRLEVTLLLTPILWPVHPLLKALQQRFGQLLPRRLGVLGIDCLTVKLQYSGISPLY